MKRVHPDPLVYLLDHEQGWEMVATRAYKLEYAVAYESSSEPDEEFGLDPY